jgi:cell division protease FtsH
VTASLLNNPLVLIPAALIVGSVLVALRMTRPGRPPSRFAPFNRFRGRGAKAMAASTATGSGAEGAFQVDKAAPGQQTVSFADVAGLDDAIAELREVTDYLSSPERFVALGAQLPRGILLYGMPGCGKTLLARALAGETGVPFYFVSASSFVEKFVGMGAARVRQLFEAAKRDAPCIVFIDELDAIGRHRNADTSGEREFDHTLNQLLVELDGFLGASGVLILGATNRPELIDPALLRPGRFDRRIRIDRPDREGREKILQLHAGGRPISRRVDWGDVAANTAGLTAAELASIVNEACLLAARRHRDRVGPDDVEEATSRVLSGTRGGAKLISEDEKRLIAMHEAGHAVLSVMLKGVTPPPRVSIVTQANAFGRSPWSSTDDREVLTKRELMAQLIVLLGGRAAEMNAFGQPSTRSEDDIEHAASLARRMVERLAMTGRFELADNDVSPKDRSREDSAGGREVRELLVRAEQAARTILRDNEGELQRIAGELLVRETLTSTELHDLLRRSSGRQAVPSA